MALDNMILILDFGSQYSQLIARRVRELGVFCEVHPYDASQSLFESLKPRGIILSGGPESVNQSNAPCAPAWVFSAGCPVLGICYGMQTMAVQLGGKVTSGKLGEYGKAALQITDSALFADIVSPFVVWMSHGDHVTQVQPGFKISAKSAIEIAAMEDVSRHFYGLQFHPEVTHTDHGLTIL